MKKLSEFAGQEHITSVLRASIIKDAPILRISVSGDAQLAEEIKQAYWQSLRCQNPVRGDACGECFSCVGFVFCPVDLDFRTEPFDDSMNFQLRVAAGTAIDPDALTLIIHAFQGEKADVMSDARVLSRIMPLREFLQILSDVFTNILYLKNNLAVVEVDRLDALRMLAVRMSQYAVVNCLRVIWDAQGHSVLSDATNIEIVSLLISEVFQPTPQQTFHEINASSAETPIEIVDNANLEQPLDLEEMLRIARQ